MEAKKIGNKIAEGRKRINMSQAELAGRLFISPQAVGKWERGESMPDIITFNRLAEIMGVDLNYFSETIQPEANGIATVELPEKQPAEMSSGKQGKKLRWDMSRGNWTDADFSGLKNLHDKFSSSNMQHCLFIGSELSGLLLRSNNIDSCDFSGSDLSNSHIQNSNLANNLFKGCSLKETEFSGSYISGCDFSSADFTGVTVKNGGLEKNNLANAVWNQVSFVDTQLADMVFEGTLEECSFENCGFTKVKFQNATLLNSFFKNNKKLNKVQFIDCKADSLTYAFLKNGKADLSGISLITV